MCRRTRSGAECCWRDHEITACTVGLFALGNRKGTHTDRCNRMTENNLGNRNKTQNRGTLVSLLWCPRQSQHNCQGVPLRGGLSCKGIEPRKKGASRPFGLSSLTRITRRHAAKREPQGFALRGSQQGSFRPASSAFATLRLRAAGSPRSPLLPPYPVSPTGKGCCCNP